MSRSARQDQRGSIRPGFTLIEVLVIIAVMVIILAVTVPRLTRPQPPYLQLGCMNNTKQMVLAWLMYASDNNDRLMPNQPYAGSASAPTNNWVCGVMDWSTNSDNTNAALFLDPNLSLIAAYLKSPGVYHCPADDSVSAAGPRVRSYSINGFMGDTGRGPALAGWRNYLKTADLASPVRKFVIVDEHPNSIDDGYFLNDPARTNVWLDLPASRHKNAGSFAFADGHSEIHRWLDSSTKQRVVPKGPKPVVAIPPRQFQDSAWMVSGATEPWTNRASGL